MRRFEYFDSLLGSPGAVLGHLRSYLQLESRDKLKAAPQVVTF